MALFASQKAIAQLAFRLGELDSEVRTLKTAHKHIELEWEELYDKVKRQMSRMSKRYAVDKKEAGEELPVESVGDQLPGADSISRSIMLRRAKPRRPE